MLIIKKYTTTPSLLDKLLCGVSSVPGSRTAGQYCNSTFKFQGTAWQVPEKRHRGWVPLATDEGSALTGLCLSFLLSSVAAVLVAELPAALPVVFTCCFLVQTRLQCVYWPLTCLLWERICSSQLPILDIWLFIFTHFSCALMLSSHQVYDLQIFLPTP